MSKDVFIRNKRRVLQEALGSAEKWIPEHERFNKTPIKAIDVSKDFMNEKRRNVSPLGSRKPPAAFRTKAVAPAQHDQTWLPPQKSRQMPEKDYSHGDVKYDDVPSPPSNPYQQNQLLGIDLSGVGPGQYCLIYDNTIWPSDSIEAIEEAVENIMRASPDIQEDELIVIKRLNIRVGVFVDG
jgi:hypothetical protein